MKKVKVVTCHLELGSILLEFKYQSIKVFLILLRSLVIKLVKTKQTIELVVLTDLTVVSVLTTPKKIPLI